MVIIVAASNETGADAIYELHHRWLADVLGPGDSLFTPGTPIWTEEHLGELERAFIDRPDLTKGKDYLVKLHEQLEDVSQEAVQLMAEVHAVHFLLIWIGVISATKKISILEAILSWMQVPPKLPNDVVRAMEPGLVHPGTWALTRRDTQIAWLIRFAQAWKDLPAERRASLLQDPWDMKTFTGTVKKSSADATRLGLLHLAFPDTFDPIVSTAHKERILSRFADQAGDDPDIDRRLLAVRAALTPEYGEGFDWYGDPLVLLWKRWKDRWEPFLGWLERVHSLSPSADPETVAFLDGGEEALGPEDVAVARKAWELLAWGDGPKGTHVYPRLRLFLNEVVRNSASWTANKWKVPLPDSGEAYVTLRAMLTLANKPEQWSDDLWEHFTSYRGEAVGADAQGGDADDTEIGSPVDHIGAAAAKLNVDRTVLDDIVDLLDDKGQVVLYGPPGTGKTYLAVKLATAIAEGNEDRVSVVQFHPATSYEDFFEGLRPKVTDAGQVTYERTSGPLVAIAEHAARDEDHRYVMVIDEINRANLPKVFGELLYLIENRGKPARTLYRPEEPFRLPKNLVFIGTMNTADRSIALIDAAMRRRFHFVPFFPHEGMMKDLLRRWLEAGKGRIAIADFLDAVNRQLLPLVGEHLLIGPSHFMKTDLSDRSLRRIWEYNIFPLIEEQLWGDQEQIRRWRWEQVKERFADVLAGKVTQDAMPESADGDDEPDTA